MGPSPCPPGCRGGRRGQAGLLARGPPGPPPPRRPLSGPTLSGPGAGACFGWRGPSRRPRLHNREVSAYSADASRPGPSGLRRADRPPAVPCQASGGPLARPDPPAAWQRSSGPPVQGPPPLAGVGQRGRQRATGTPRPPTASRPRHPRRCQDWGLGSRDDGVGGGADPWSSQAPGGWQRPRPQPAWPRGPWTGAQLPRCGVLGTRARAAQPPSPSRSGCCQRCGEAEDNGGNYYVFTQLEPGPSPREADNRGAASYVSELRARAGCDNKRTVPRARHCHRATGPPAHGVGVPGRPGEDEQALGPPIGQARAAAGPEGTGGDPPPAAGTVHAWPGDSAAGEAVLGVLLARGTGFHL